ncbi:hypothetical protein [Niallia circulans]|uniref:hypothetical protein n=2 Tax=Niallia circulans TaxID=1397 RepID=UPI0030EF0974
MLNVYRINRLTNWEFGTINMLTGTAIIVEFVVGTILIILLTKIGWMGERQVFGLSFFGCHILYFWFIYLLFYFQ